MSSAPAGIPEPQATGELVGHERAVTVLAQAWQSGRLAHGWLIGGPRGVGKATLAFRFARALLAGRAAADQRLGIAPEHPVSRQVAAGAHPDLRVLALPRDPKTGRPKSEIPVDAVRTATQALYGTAAMGGHRVLIVDGAEHLNRSAANALLKPLEEPPAGAILLLVSHQPARLLPTLRSRCAKLRLAGLTEDQVQAVLARHLSELDPDERLAAARLARGSPGRALELVARGALPLYRRLADALAREPADRDALHEVAGELARHADQHGTTAITILMQELLGRGLAGTLGQAEGELYPGEAAALDRLMRRRPLDRWAALWEKVARLAARTDAVNLDRAHVLLHVLTLLAAPPGERDGPRVGGVPHGDLHALG